MPANIHCRPIMPPSNLAAYWHGKPMHALRLATILANLRRLVR